MADSPFADVDAVSLPSDPKARKTIPLFSGLLRYFPDALCAVAACSYQGNEQHNPGQPLHWDRSKSKDQHDCLMRHLLEAGTVDGDGIRHSAKVAWRALAALQLELEVAVLNSATNVAKTATPDLALLAAHVEPGPLPAVEPLITSREPPEDDE